MEELSLAPARGIKKITAMMIRLAYGKCKMGELAVRLFDNLFDMTRCGVDDQAGWPAMRLS